MGYQPSCGPNGYFSVHPTGAKRRIEPSAEISLPKRVGQTFIQTHNLESVCEQIERLSHRRDTILEHRMFLKSAQAQEVLRIANSMACRERTYLAKEARLEEDLAKWPEEVRKVLKPVFEKAKFPAGDRVYQGGEMESAGSSSETSVESEEGKETPIFKAEDDSEI